MRYALTLLCGCLLLSGCQSPRHEHVYQAQHDARIRLYGHNGLGVAAFSDTRCTAPHKPHMIEVGMSFNDAFGSMTRQTEDQRMGIPETPFSRRVAAANGKTLGRIIIREWGVPGGKPVTVQLYHSQDQISRTRSCHVAASFTAKARHDYEIETALDKGSCSLSVNEIHTGADGRVFTVPVSLQRCPTDSFHSWRNRLNELPDNPLVNTVLPGASALKKVVQDPTRLIVPPILYPWFDKKRKGLQ